MNARTVASVLIAVACAASRARAQTSDDFAGWLALLQTPIGALPAIDAQPTLDGTHRIPTWALRATSWKFEGQPDHNNAYAGSLIAPVGARMVVTGTIGYLHAGSGGDGATALGIDAAQQIWTTTRATTQLTIGIKGSFGYGHQSGDVGYNSTALAASLPLGARYTLANKSSLSVILTPGLGYGRISGASSGVDNGSSMRQLIGLGAAWTSASNFGVHVGMQKVMIDGKPPWILGLAVSIPGSR